MRHRPRPDADFGDMEILSLVRKAFLRESLDHDFSGFFETLARFVDRHAEALVFRRGRAAAKTEDGPAAGQHVERRYLLGDADRVVPRQHDDRGHQLYATGATGHVREQLRVIRNHRVAGKVMLHANQRIESQRFDQIDQREFLLINLIVGPGPRVDHRNTHANFHLTSPQALSARCYAKISPVLKAGS